MNPPNRFCFRGLPVTTAAIAVFLAIFFSVLVTSHAQAAPKVQGDTPPGGDDSRKFVQVVAGEEHACGLTDAGSVYCWGSNGNDQLGDGTGLDSSIAVPVAGLESGVVQLAAGGFETCALLENGSAQCWPHG
jgi:alpha-tubulin suppressor-like RCC1 family protein